MFEDELNMYCTNCAAHMENCKCLDANERLLEIRDTFEHVTVKWCIACDLHWSRCKCESSGKSPRWRIYCAGKQVDPRKLKSVMGKSVHEMYPDIEIPEEFL